MTLGPEPPPPAVPVVAAEPFPVVIQKPGDVPHPTSEPAREAAAHGKRIEDALVTHGQRRINLIWERTQAFIALSVVTTTLLVAGWLAISGNQDVQSLAFVLLANLVGNVTGFYFARTNHERTGGVIAGETGR